MITREQRATLTTLIQDSQVAEIDYERAGVGNAEACSKAVKAYNRLVDFLEEITELRVITREQCVTLVTLIQYSQVAESDYERSGHGSAQRPYMEVFTAFNNLVDFLEEITEPEDPSGD